MRLLDVYIARHVVRGALIALVALLALFTFIALVDDLDNVGRGEYTLGRALEYMVLTMPTRTLNLLPLAALIGALTGLGALAASSELAVIRASGVSVMRISSAVMGGALLLMLVAVVIGELVAPASERLAQSRRSVAISEELAMNTRYGFWVRDGNSFINIRRVLPGGKMQDVYIYEFDDARRLRVATHAREAIHGDEGWLLRDVAQSRLEPGRVVRDQLEQARWQSGFEPDLVDVVSVKPESLSALGLRRYIRYLSQNGLDTSRFELALWNKLAYPLATGVMIFLAIPMVLSRLKTAGLGQRILVGVVVGVAFHVLDQAAGHVGLVYGLHPAASALAPTLLFLVAAVSLARRVR